MDLKYAYFLTLIIAFSQCLTSCNNQRETPEEKVNNPLLGSWEISSIYWITNDTTYSLEKAQPGLLLITPDRYSIMWTPTEEPRVPFENLSAPTDDEMKEGFQSIVFNAGTYTNTDSTLTTQAQVAKVPGFEGGKQFYEYHIEKGKLELIMYDETYPDGKKPYWFGKLKTKFILNKTD